MLMSNVVSDDGTSDASCDLQHADERGQFRSATSVNLPPPSPCLLTCSDVSLVSFLEAFLVHIILIQFQSCATISRKVSRNYCTIIFKNWTKTPSFLHIIPKPYNPYFLPARLFACPSFCLQHLSLAFNTMTILN